MKFEDCYSPRQIELWRFAIKLKRLGLSNQMFITEMDDFYREHIGIMRRTGWAADPELYDLVVSLLNTSPKDMGKRV